MDNTLATWCEKLTHLKRPWCWERLKAGGEGDNRGWDGGMASVTQWTWVWASSGSWWWTGQLGMLQSTGSQIAEKISISEMLVLDSKYVNSSSSLVIPPAFPPAKYNTWTIFETSDGSQWSWREDGHLLDILSHIFLIYYYMSFIFIYKHHSEWSTQYF